MEATTKKQEKKASVKPAKTKLQAKPETKSPIALFWEKYPNGILTIINERAVLR